jgi:hypothetical protein
MDDHTRLPEDRCPYCRKELNCATPASAKPDTPRPGDIMVCLGCGGALVLKDDMTHRIIYLKELAALSPDQRETLVRAQWAVRLGP